MPDPGASPQAGQQSSSPQAGQSSPEQAPSFSQQVFGTPAGQQPVQPGAGQQPVKLEGMKDGESIEAFFSRQAKEVSDARKEAARYRTELRKLAGETSPGEDGLTDFQRLQKQVETLQSDLSTERQARSKEKVSTSLISALAEAGAVNPTLAIRLIDAQTELELGADGQPTPESVVSAVANLATKMPQIFGDVRGSGDGQAGNSFQPESQDFNAMLRARARR